MKQNVEFIRISRNGWDSGTYRGELSVVGASRRRHGRGVMDYDYGERYDGEWRVTSATAGSLRAPGVGCGRGWDAAGRGGVVANDAQRTLTEVLMVIPHAVTCRCCCCRRRRDMMNSPTRNTRGNSKAFAYAAAKQQRPASSIADAVHLWQLNE